MYNLITIHDMFIYTKVLLVNFINLCRNILNNFPRGKLSRIIIFELIKVTK